MTKFLLALTAAASLAAFGPAQAQTATYTVDPTHTFVTWEALHFGTSTSRGRFDKKEGRIEIDRSAKTGMVDITIDMASITTGVAPGLRRRLRDHRPAQPLRQHLRPARHSRQRAPAGADRSHQAVTKQGRSAWGSIGA